MNIYISKEGIYEIEIEEGDVCLSCHEGIYIFPPVENCYCHMGRPPCSNCTNQQLECSICGETQTMAIGEKFLDESEFIL